MSTVLHLSDLHFGPKHLPHLADLVLDDIRRLAPDLVVISGDFTMRGRMSEYSDARAYIHKISAPVFTIPGNHDQPLYPSALIERLARPLKRYQSFIHPQLDSVFARGDLYVVGLNDNHPILPGGFWSKRRRAWLAGELSTAPPGACRIIVTHHQLIWHKPRPAGVWNASEKLSWLAENRVEIVLNGHTHVPRADKTSAGVVVVQAGTATCSRVRHGHGNSYNLIEITPNDINVAVHRYVPSADEFEPQENYSFSREMIRAGA